MTQFQNMPDHRTNDERRKKLEEAISERSSLFRAVFLTDQGQKVLQVLIDSTITKPCWDPTLDNSEKVAYYREGENNVVRTILNIIYNPRGQ